MIYLTLDIGGSAIKYALIDDEMTILEKGHVEAPKDNIEQFLKNIFLLYNQYKDKISGIGISMPGVINPKTGFAKTGGAFSFIANINIVEKLQRCAPPHPALVCIFNHCISSPKKLTTSSKASNFCCVLSSIHS